ncbi:ABC transporter ATP-binding protein [Puniceibacterium sp. IMCC21224]|uniref:ABC transporter ATP-binding protein n=1 Tax=Puniceibacterium sp. IMCC21224 TaxID=1618204 RepID=UPI00064DA706|nr:ABC transporter ATP-binding protein [Puniceibacterium sp. IMCC21224]KMK67001.1 ABC-type cobalamin/Fe3+-siderophore transport system, ATPase component [Puniceibacterium sp. IMCC21224]
MANGLSIRNLHLRRGGAEVLRGIDLPTLPPGSLTALIGPNGAGKTTLLQSLAGLLPASGAVSLNDVDLSQIGRRERAQLVGYMPQSTEQNAELSVLDAVLTALRAAPGGSAPDQARRQAVAMLSRLGIADLALRPLSRLSGGQRQLAGLAQTLIRQPKVLLLDEPTSALDPRRQFEVMEILRDVLTSSQALGIVVLHDLELSLRWADRIVLMQAGQVIAAGLPEEVVTPTTLARAYDVQARVERCSRGFLHVHTDGVRHADAC